MPDNPPFTPPPSAAVQDLTTPPAPIDLAKLQANDAIELARLEQMSMQSAQTDAQRLAQMASGQPLDMANENTTGQQLSNRNFTDAVTDLLDRGARPDLVVNYLASGRSDDPRGHEFAAEWFRRLETDREMQRK